MKLEILIPYHAPHTRMAHELHSELSRQIHYCGATGKVAVTTLPDVFSNRGRIRNKCLEISRGEYVCFFDADDKPSKDYISKSLKALEENPDCCSLTGVITFDGENPEIFEHSIKYNKYRTNNSTAGVKYERYPNHLNIIKSSIAKQFKFPEIDFGEDTDWATQIHNSGLLKKEATIEGVIYHYQFTNK